MKKSIYQMENTAKTLSQDDTSCDHCVYDGEDNFTCRCPYSDFMLEDGDIDPCYEGVLIHLAIEEGEKRNGQHTKQEKPTL